MRGKTRIKKDSAIGVIPSAPWRVIEVYPLPDYRLRVRFVDGIEGEVDLSQLVRSPSAGVFGALNDAKMFDQVYLAYGAVTWPCGVDLAPDAMHEAIKQHGKWILK